VPATLSAAAADPKGEMNHVPDLEMVYEESSVVLEDSSSL
jgi:hypothetical protein